MKALHAVEERYREQQQQKEAEEGEEEAKEKAAKAAAAKKKRRTAGGGRRRATKRKKKAEEEEEEEGEEGEEKVQERMTLADVVKEMVELIKNQKLVFLVELYKRHAEGVEKDITTLWKAPTTTTK